MSSQAWKGMSKDSWQKHTDDNHLYASIRYQQMPFIVPKPDPTKKQVPLQQKLEKEVEKKFLSGDHRFANQLALLATFVKPIFLIITLPFYFVLYFIPAWLYEKGTWLFKKINTFFLPIQKKLTQNISFVKLLFSKYRTVKENIIKKISAYSNDMKKRSHFLFEKTKDVRSIKTKFTLIFFSKLNFLKSKWLSFESKLRGYSQNLEKRISKIIEAPFIYVIDRIKQTALLCYRNYFEPPKKRLLKIVTDLKIRKKMVDDRIRHKINQVKDYVNKLKNEFFKSKGKHFKVSSLSKFLSSKKDLLAKFLNPVKDVKNAVRNFINTQISMRAKEGFSKVSNIFQKPLDYYNYFIQEYEKAKFRVKHFIIHLPGMVKKKIGEGAVRLEVKLRGFSNHLNKFSDKISSRIEAFSRTLIGVIPTPVKNMFYQFVTLSKSIKKNISEKKQELMFMLLLLRVWIKVICRHSMGIVSGYKNSWKVKLT